MRTKRILSFILAFAMVVSMLPTFTFASAEEPVVYTYNITNAALGAELVSGKNYADLKTNAGVEATLSGNTWKASYVNTYQRRLLEDGFSGNVQYANIATNNGVVIAITVPTAGKYVPEVTFDMAKGGGKIGARFISETQRAENEWTLTNNTGMLEAIGELPLAESELVDTYDASASNFSMDTEKVVEYDVVELDSGVNYVIFNVEGYNTKLGDSPIPVMEFSKITLTEYIPPAGTVEYEYRTMWDEFNTDDMWWSYSNSETVEGTNVAASEYGSWRNFPGVRTGGYNKKGAIANYALIGTAATVSVGSDGVALDTPMNTMKQDTDNGEWELVTTRNPGIFNVAEDANGISMNFEGSRFGNTSRGSYMMLRINVPAKGKYTLSYNGNRDAAFAAPAVYFVKDDGGTIADYSAGYAYFKDETPIGYANFSDISKTGYVNVGTAEVDAAGDYFVIFYADSNSALKSTSTVTNPIIELQGIKLTTFAEGDDANDLLSLELTSSLSELAEGETANLTAVADYSRTGLEIVSDGITYESSDESIATVSDTGVVTAVGDGVVTITAAIDGTDISDTVIIDVIGYDPGNRRVIVEYKTTWEALSGDKLPSTSDSSLYTTGTYTRYDKSGNIIQNTALMNRDATSTLDADGNTVEEWKLMDESVTAEWDWFAATSTSGTRINKVENAMWQSFKTTTYGTDSAHMLALCVNVPNKGTYNLAIDTMYRTDGIAAAVYFIRDDGSIANKTDLMSAVAAATPVGYHNSSDASKSGYQIIGQVEAPRKGDYFVVFVGDEESLAKNETATNSHQYLYINGIRMSVPPGAVETVNVSIDGIENEGDPMPLMTEKQIVFEMFDEDGIEFEQIDEDKLTVVYSSGNEAVATVSETGLVSAVGNGSATLTMDITYDGTNVQKEYNLVVAPAGKNLMEDLNPDFENDDWFWSYAYEPEATGESKFIRAAIETAPKSDDADNRAFVWILDGEVPAVSNPAALTLEADGSRIAVKPDNFYQLIFKVKADYVNPEDASDMNLYLDVYTYDGPTSSGTGYDSGRSMNLTSTANWRELTNDWYEVVLPLPAPAVTELETVYMTPRFAIRPNSADLSKAGYQGKVWFDDFELREVGYAGVEVEIQGDTTSGTTSDFTIVTKPYTTLGHYISLWDEMSTKDISVASNDENVIGNIKNAEITLSETGSGMYFAETSAKSGGKNGTADISAEITLNGVTRRGEGSVTTSGFALRLLYASLAADDIMIAAGESTKVVPTGYMTDGTVADMTSGIITYKSLTPDIVSVDGDGNVTALRAGEGIIQVNMLLDDNGAQAETAIIITDDSPIKEASLTGLGTVGYLRDEELMLSGITEGGFAADMEAAEVNWIIAGDDGAVSIRNGNFVFGEKLGASATISAEITLNGATVTTNTLEVEVVETDLRDFMIDFRKASQSRAIDVTIEEDHWEINKDGTSKNAQASTFNTMGLLGATKSVSETLTIDIDLPYEGAYQIILTGTYYTYNAYEGDVYIDGIYVGDYTYYNGTNAPAEPERLRSVYLTAGKHTVTFKPTLIGPRRAWQTLKELRFNAVEDIAGISSLTTSKDKYYLAPSEETELDLTVVMYDGFKYGLQKTLSGADDAVVSASFDSADKGVATIDSDGTITAHSVGETEITIKVTDGESTLTKTVIVSVSATGDSDDEALETIEISAPSFVMSPDSDGVQLTASGRTGDGAAFDISQMQITWTSSDEDVAKASESGFVTPVSNGTAYITATVAADNGEFSAEVIISVRSGKVGRTYYSDEMIEAARENILRYSWASDIKKSAEKVSQKYIGKEDEIWNIIPGEGIPRGYGVGYRDDPERANCRYCGADFKETHNTEVLSSDPISKPWKVQCMECKRFFPSNDFASLYELGKGDDGVFSLDLALEKHEELFGGTYGTGYLKNELYPEIGTANHPASVKFTAGETTEMWGVDDGFGYHTGRVYSNGVEEVHTYIANYHYGIWYGGYIYNAVNNLRDAYLYTGDAKYGRVGAIMLDRIADVYPDFDLRPYLPEFANGDGSSGMGKTVGKIHETYLEQNYAKAYDAFFPMYDDPQVVKFLSDKKAEWTGIEYDKSTPEGIRSNIEDGILRETYNAVSSYLSHGNFGMHQAACAIAAVVLDTYPDTDIMLDWITKYSVTSKNPAMNTGGGVNQRLIEDVSRDGQGNESAPGYNRIWITELSDLADTIAKYPEYTGKELNLYEHPKYIGMIKSYAPFTLVRRGVPSIGDSGLAGSYSPQPDEDFVLINSFKYTGDPMIAQHLYFLKGGELEDIHYDIFTKDPESLASDVEAIIEEYGEYDYDRSSMLTGYGFGALRDGTLYDTVGNDVVRDMTRSFWMYFGGSASHNHEDKLNLGIEAYGIGMTADLGYPEATGSDQNRIQWQNATISHNTVVVNEQTQLKSQSPHKPLHFDTKDTRVKVMDIDATTAYTATDEYRRTIVMVDYDDEISYGIDFFKVLGGEDHLYSFHASSETNPRTSENLEFETQVAGTYAGASVPFGPDPYSSSATSYNILKYPIGYTWLTDIKRADNPGTGEFWLEWDIKDIRKFSRNENMDIKLRMTMVNDWDADEVTLANGLPPRKPNNINYIDHFEYVLVRRTGHDLDTLFTTVFEPYNKNRYIESIENVPVTVADGTPRKDASAKAVKVTLVDGRVDYVVYAQDNTVTYNVGDVFEFRGFVGVYTVNEDGVNIYNYINDGDKIGDNNELTASLTGTITDYTRTLSLENELVVEFDTAPENPQDLVGRMIDVEREGLGNSAYIIEGVTMTDDTHASIALGRVTPISGFVDAEDETLGYTYDVAEGKSFKIGLSYEANPAPVFDEVSDNLTTSAGSTIVVDVNAESDTGTVTYSARTLPRGASFDTETGKFSWKPASSQIGENLVAIDATDEDGRTSTLYFTITVYGSTTGGTGGGGGSGTSSPSTTPDSGSDDDDDSSTTTPDEGSTTKPEDGSGADAENVRFIDLGNHVWAADSINSLADDGIVKGTTPNTYSPANNITRADFAILLVRAFELESDNAENFDDVSDSDYFAAELAIARNTGIVNGIGNNKYAPRNTITRQDMMLILYRALVNLGVEFEIAEIDYPDVADISDYAEEAVKALVLAGLVNGKSGRLAPKDYTTRAEVAVLLKRILNYTSK